MQELVRTDRTLAERIRDFFEEFFDELTQMVAQLAFGEANKTEAAYLIADQETVREIADLFTAALESTNNSGLFSETAENGEYGTNYDGNQTEGWKSTEGNGDIWHSVVTLKDGSKFVQADREVIKGNNPDRWSLQILEYFDEIVNSEGYLEVPTTDGDVIRITTASEGFTNTTGKVSSFADGYLYDEYGNFDYSKARVKANAAIHIDEILSIAEDDRPGKPNKSDTKAENHQDFAANGWRYKEAFFNDSSGYYMIKVSVAYGADGKIRAYNIGQIKERTRPDLNGSSLSGAPYSGPRSTYSIRSTTKKSNPPSENSEENLFDDLLNSGNQPRMSVKTSYDYSKSFAEQVDDWVAGNIPANDTLLIGRTPMLYRQIGLSDLPLTVDQMHIDYMINGTKGIDHHLGTELAKQLPELIENPVAIIESATRPNNSVMSIVNGEVNGKQIVAAVRIGSTGTQNSTQIDSNHIVSAQGRGNAISKLLNDAIQKELRGAVGVYYWNKDEALPLTVQSGVQFPGGHINDGLIHSIFDASSPVNRVNLIEWKRGVAPAPSAFLSDREVENLIALEELEA